MGFVEDFFAELAHQTVIWILETTVAMIVVVIGWILDSPDAAMATPAMQGMIAQGIAVGRYVLPLMLLLGLIQAGIQGRPGAVARLAFIEMPLVAVAMVIIAPVTGLLLAAADALTEWVIDEAAITTMQSAFNTLPSAAFLAAAPHFLPIVGVLSLIALIGAMLVWGMMLMRNLGVALSVLIGPGMLATRLWPAAQSWATTWASLLIALILVKPAIGFMLSLSWVMIGAGIDPVRGFVDIQAVAMGLMAFIAAALVPSFMFKFIPQVGDVVAGRLSSGLGGVAMTAVGIGTTVAFAARGLRAPGGGTGATPGGGQRARSRSRRPGIDPRRLHRRLRSDRRVGSSDRTAPWPRLPQVGPARSLPCLLLAPGFGDGPRARDGCPPAGGRPGRASSHPCLGDRRTRAARLDRYACLEPRRSRTEVSCGRIESGQEAKTRLGSTAVFLAGRGRTVRLPPPSRHHGRRFRSRTVPCCDASLTHQGPLATKPCRA